MLDVRVEHGIAADVETIRIRQIDKAYHRMQRSHVKYRFTIDNGLLAA